MGKCILDLAIGTVQGFTIAVVPVLAYVRFFVEGYYS